MLYRNYHYFYWHPQRIVDGCAGLEGEGNPEDWIRSIKNLSTHKYSQCVVLMGHHVPECTRRTAELVVVSCVTRQYFNVCPVMVIEEFTRPLRRVPANECRQVNRSALISSGGDNLLNCNSLSSGQVEREHGVGERNCRNSPAITFVCDTDGGWVDGSPLGPFSS